MTDAVPPHPYAALPPEAFWRPAVAQADRRRFPALYRPAARITPDTRIATLGSCFAQHIGRALGAAGCTVLDAEPAPEVMPDAVAHAYGYRLFSARTGNIYTTRALREFLDDVLSGHVDAGLVWERDGRFVDALRPRVEPDGLASVAEVLWHRDYHLERTARMLGTADLFIFTMGLTEGWVDRITDRALPLAPGVVAGRFDPARYAPVNATHAQVLDDLRAIHAQLRQFNPAMRMLLTVSPVPLTATVTGQHVLTATSQAKSTLRAAAGECVATCPGVDYFPSYELVTHPAAGGPWFEPNLRNVSAAGVARVMDVFLTAHGLDSAATPPVPADDGTGADGSEGDGSEDALVCDELLLQAFAR